MCAKEIYVLDTNGELAIAGLDEADVLRENVWRGRWAAELVHGNVRQVL